MTSTANSGNESNFTGKVAIATNDQKTVTAHIGRCRSFVVVDIASGKVTGRETRANTFTHHRMMNEHHQHHGHGEGHHSHQGLINGLSDCDYMISSGGGWRVVEDLRRNNIETLFTDVKSIDEAVEKLINGQLINQDDLTCRDHGH